MISAIIPVCLPVVLVISLVIVILPQGNCIALYSLLIFVAAVIIVSIAVSLFLVLLCQFFCNWKRCLCTYNPPVPTKALGLMNHLDVKK